MRRKINRDGRKGVGRAGLDTHPPPRPPGGPRNMGSASEKGETFCKAPDH